MTAPATVKNLVERFEEHREAYRSGRYNETQLRREFLDPFFEALGWDVTNKGNYAEMYKDVIHEDSLEIEGENKAPDYAFRIGGTRKFFVEAKKPAVNIEWNIHPAFQLRRYAWSAKLPLSILTDFEEFAVYDCRIKPDKGDKASVGRIKLYSFREYVDHWDEIAAVFSRDAVLKGSFDSYAEGLKGRKGTTAVDDAFLGEIERWRELLAKNIALRNPTLSVRELNYAVQMTIDRIVFLRICEDRGVERDEQLKEIAAPSVPPPNPQPNKKLSTQNSNAYLGEVSRRDGGGIYASLCQLFRRADTRYNSGLFHFTDEKGQSSAADSLTLHLKIDDKVLQEIIRNLYYPESPYVFREIPADILGQVYERFLGKVIRLTAAHQAKVEEKSEVRKAGGVYYTPTYIVEYIVQNTVGRLLEGKTPKDAAKLKILDPACGSGTFPLGAYQYLLDWHLRWYIDHEPEKWAAGKNPAIYEISSPKSDVLQSDLGEVPAKRAVGVGRGYQLTTAKKKEILLNNIYAVDIDAQAVEVTKLSLLLKVLEGENQETIGSQLSLLQERVLPDLAKNIQCGNSLIGPDYYQDKQLALSFVDDEERYRVNAFDWKAAFPQVFMQGGFDAVIGNPPYVRQEGLGYAKQYFQSHYKTFVPTADLYVNFVEKELGLLGENGLFGVIVSNKWLRAAYGLPLRKLIKEQVSLLQVLDLAGLPVFEGATVRTVILICSPSQNTNDKFAYLAPVSLDNFRKIQNGDDLQKAFKRNAMELDISNLKAEGWTFSDSRSAGLLSKLQNKGITITKYTKGKLLRGVITGLNEAFIIDRKTRDEFIHKNPLNQEILKPLLVGKNLKRYSHLSDDIYLIWTYIGIPIEKYPEIFEHLKKHQPQLEKRWDKGNHWWELRACDYYDKFEMPKIIYPDIATSCRFYLDEAGYFSTNTTYFVPSSDRYLLGILNSKVAQFFFTQVCAGLEGGGTVYLRFFGQYIKNFPVHIINFSDPVDKARHDKMVSLVERMLLLHKQLDPHRLANSGGGRTPQEQEMITREIESTDRAIDNLVYELYGLTDEEIKIVEGRE